VAELFVIELREAFNRGGRGEKPLTAKGAKKSRKERKENIFQ
jgi:hypothetical protein